MESSVIAGWTDFLAASAGAAAALAGLVFVSISINLTRILATPGIPARAAETIILLAGTLAGSLVALMPWRSAPILGLALCVTAVPTWLLPIFIHIRAIRTRTYYRALHAVLRVGLHQLATLPGVFAGLSLCGHFGGGLAWFAVGAVASMLVGIFNAWVLLIEILR